MKYNRLLEKDSEPAKASIVKPRGGAVHSAGNCQDISGANGMHRIAVAKNSAHAWNLRVPGVENLA